MTLLSKETFLTIVAHTPLVSIDLIVRNNERKTLVGLRRNEPAKGYYFVPGGRIQKDETLEAALHRVSLSELGVDASGAKFSGVYQHFYPTNFAEAESITTHYVVLAHVWDLPEGQEIKIDSQHSEFLWLSADEAESLGNVHKNTLAYYRDGLC